MRAWPEFEDVLTNPVTDDFPAVYTITAEVYRGRYTDMARATLERWTFGDREMTRHTAIQLLGDDAVRAEEARAGNLWWERYGERKIAAQ